MTAAVLKRRIGFWLVTFYGVGVMVGAGIYVLVGAVAGASGLWAPLAFLIAAIVALPTAMSYAELTGRIPEAAGEAAYLRAATARIWPAVLVGLGLTATGVISAAVVLQGGVGYLLALVAWPEPILIVGIGVVLGGIAVLGVLESLSFMAILTVVEIAGLLIVAAVGFTGPAVDIALPAFDGSALAAIGAGALLAFFAFLGFEDIVNMVEETREPARTLPRALFTALALTTLLYLLVVLAALRSVPLDLLAESRRPLALVYETATGSGAGFLIVIAGAAALNGILAQIVMSARVLFGMGRFFAPFRVFHRAHPRFGTPLLATVLATAITIVLALSAPLERLAAASAMILLAVFCMVNFALILLKRRSAAPAEGFEAAPWIPYVGVAGSLAMLIAPLVL